MSKEQHTDTPETIAGARVDIDQLTESLSVERAEVGRLVRNPQDWTIPQLARVTRALDVDASALLAWLLARR